MYRSRFLTLLFAGFVLMAQQAAGGEPLPRLDHYGDPLPKGVRFRLGSVRLRHETDVMAVSWMPDGRTLASAGWDRTVRLWQIPGGKLIAKWENLEGVVFSPDGRCLACGKEFDFDEERAIRIVDVATGKERRRIRVAKNGGTLVNLTPGYPLGFYSPDGKTLAVREGGVRLYAVESGKELGFLKAKVIDFGRPVVFSPDGRTLLVAAEDGLYRWRIGTGAKDKILADNEESAFSFAFSPDGKMLAAASDDFVTLRSWPAGKELRRLPMTDDSELTDDSRSSVLTFSPNGKLLAASSCGTIRLWNPATGKQVRRFEGHGGNYIRDLAFSPDGSLLASAGSDNTVAVWEVRAGKSPLPLTGVSHWLHLAGLATDGQTLLTCSDDGVLTLWNSRDGHRLRTLTNGLGSAESVLFGPDASRKRALLRQEVESHRNRPMFAQERICCTVFSPDNAMMAVGSTDGILLLRKTSKGIERRFLDEEARAKNTKAKKINISVSALTFSPDGRTLAACYTDGRLFLWEPRNGRPRHILSFPEHGESYQYLAFSPDGRLLALSDRHALYLVESASGQQFRERLLGQDWIDSLAFAPDNRTLALGDAGSLVAIHLWDLPTDKQIHALQGHLDRIRTLVFSPDGTFLLSGSSDNTILSWDIAAVMRRRQTGKDLSPAKLSELWTDLASKDATRAQRAVAELIQVPNAALPFLDKSLPPVPPAKMVGIVALIADLDHEQFARREYASKELENIGDSAAPALRNALKNKPSLEARKRMEALLETIDGQAITSESLRIVRALQTLESIGTPETKQILERLAGGAAEARLTEEAKAGLRRLSRRAINPQ